MYKISEVKQKIIEEEEDILLLGSQKLINTSSYARKIRPYVEKILMKEVKEGSISSVKKALESMKNGSAPVKITEAEEATRIAPSKVAKALSADRAYTELKSKYSKQLLTKTDEFTKNPKYKTLNQDEKDLFKYFNKSKYTKVPA